MCAARTAEVAPYPRDDELRINQLQARRHAEQLPPPTAGPEPWCRKWDYAHPPLDRQLDEGVRQLELDVHYAADGRFRVFNVPTGDENTTCALAARLPERGARLVRCGTPSTIPSSC